MDTFDEKNKPIDTNISKINVVVGNVSRISPISNREKRITVYLGVMFFSICMSNTLLEIFKDIIIISRQIPSSLYFIKLFLVFPMTLTAMYLIQIGLSRYSFSTVFNVINFSFCSTFLLFGLCFIPFQDRIQKGSIWVHDTFGEGKMKIKGLGVLLPISYIFCEWVYTVVYIVSELWGSVMVSYLFYSFANSICSPSEMENIMPYFSSITAVSMIFSAILLGIFKHLRVNTTLEASNNIFTLFFILLALVTILIYFLKKTLEAKYSLLNYHLDIPKKEVRRESLSSLLNSRLLVNMCVITTIYAINGGLIDASFKNCLSAGAYLSNLAVDVYSGKFFLVSLLIVSFSILSLNFISRSTIKRKGWLFMSMISPVVSLLSTFFVIGLSGYNYYFGQKGSSRNPFYLNLENWLATFSLSFIRISKYTFFDTAKEMLSVRVNERYRNKYKSVYDGVCIKLGRSISSMYGTLFTLLGYNDIRAASPFTFIVLLANCIFWMRAVYYLNKKYSEAVGNNIEIDVDIKKSE